MEKDDEVKGSGNSYNFGARIHDPRIGRFLSVDPMAPNFPGMTPYSFAANTPIAAIDRDGKFAQIVIKYGIDVGINIATQMLTAYLFDDNVNSVGDAWDEVSLWQAFGDGVVDQLGTKKLRMAANATMGIFTYIDQVGLENATFEGILLNGGIGLLEPIIGDAIAKYGKKAVLKGLKSIDLDYGTLTSAMGGGLRKINKTINNVTSSRMIKGWSKGKVAVIGRNMDRVKSFGKGVGATVENGGIFKPTDEAIELARKGDNSLLMQQNKEWIQGLKDQGYTIYDVGLDPDYSSRGDYYDTPYSGDYDEGDFYEMEINEVFGDN